MAEKEDGEKHLLDVVDCWTSIPFQGQSLIQRKSALRFIAMLRSDFTYSS